jgi:hypothetical protein
MDPDPALQISEHETSQLFSVCLRKEIARFACFHAVVKDKTDGSLVYKRCCPGKGFPAPYWIDTFSSLISGICPVIFFTLTTWGKWLLQTLIRGTSQKFKNKQRALFRPKTIYIFYI